MGFEQALALYEERKVLALPAPAKRPERIETLIQMLTYRRPAGSKSEKKFIRRFLHPLGVKADDYGNLYKSIGDAPILWSCHTDTVHREGGRQGIKVKGNIVHVADDNSNCLGADCTAGVWIMTEMIKANIPGLYIFHREEEKAGKGSAWIAKHYADDLKKYQFAIAFDRRGTGSIITHQYGGRCCSHTFYESLTTAIGMGHKNDSGGSFTDTASYTDLIGECTNISVGYYDEHSKLETLDISYLDELRAAMVQADFADLISERKPGEVEWDDWDDYRYQGLYGTIGRGTRNRYDSGWAYGANQGVNSMYQLCKDHPAEVADFLEECGIDAEELEEALYMRGAVLRR